MYTDDSGGPWGDHAPNCSRIQIVRCGVDICEDRRDLLPWQCMRGGDEGVRRDDPLALQLKSTRRDFQRDCPVAHGNAMFDAKKRANPLLELLCNRPIVGKPTAIENVGCALQKALVV